MCDDENESIWFVWRDSQDTGKLKKLDCFKDWTKII